MIALLDKSFIIPGYGKGKWSTEPGAISLKMSFWPLETISYSR